MDCPYCGNEMEAVEDNTSNTTTHICHDCRHAEKVDNCVEGDCGECAFCQWTKRVDNACKRQTGMGMYDYPDIDYRAHYKAGYIPKDMPRIIVDAGFGPGTFDRTFN